MTHGEARAAEFLTALAFESAWMARDVDATVAFLSDDVLLESEAPFPTHGPARGRARAARFLRAHLPDAAVIDVTRKQIAAERVSWSARWQPRVTHPRRCAARSSRNSTAIAWCRCSSPPRPEPPHRRRRAHQRERRA